MSCYATRRMHSLQAVHCTGCSSASSCHLAQVLELILDSLAASLSEEGMQHFAHNKHTSTSICTVEDHNLICCFSPRFPKQTLDGGGVRCAWNVAALVAHPLSLLQSVNWLLISMSITRSNTAARPSSEPCGSRHLSSPLSMPAEAPAGGC